MAGRPTDRVTLHDVARLAGVTKGTVSKVLNERSDVAADTRARVRAAVSELGYRPPRSSGGAPGPRTVAAVLDVIDSPYIINVLQGILSAATAADADLLVRLAPERTVRTSRGAARDWVAEQRAAGVVGVIGLTLGEPAAILRAAREAGLPFVVVDPVDLDDPTVVSIGSTNWAGGRSATEHLLELGHRRIAWLGGPATSAPARERLHGHRAALDSAGVPQDPRLTRHVAFSVDAGRTHGRELLELPDPPTAVVAGNDEIAVGVVAVARELGLEVPTRLSVVGFDDTPQASWTSPPLTTVHQPLTGMGRMAVETVLAMAAGREPASRHVQLATSLVVRGSTAPASPVDR